MNRIQLTAAGAQPAPATASYSAATALPTVASLTWIFGCFFAAGMLSSTLRG